MLQLDKGENGKNPADFSECWIKHLLNNLNSRKIPLSTFFYLLLWWVALCFCKGEKHFYLFCTVFLRNCG